MKCSMCEGNAFSEDELVTNGKVRICYECAEMSAEILAERLGLYGDYPGNQEGNFIFTPSNGAPSTQKKHGKAGTGAQQSAIIDNPRAIKEYLDQIAIGQDMAKQNIAVGVYKHFARINHNHSGDPQKIDKQNILLVGPTGSGKTLMVEALAGLAGVPFSSFDMSGMTQAGYVGSKPEDALVGLLMATQMKMQSEGNANPKMQEVLARMQNGIILLDEFDKIRLNSGGSGGADVNGRGAQQSILRMIQGDKVTVTIGGGPMAQQVQIDTSNILFIAAGAFSGIEAIVEQRLSKQHGHGSAGFGANHSHKMVKPSLNELLAQVTTEDLQQFGMMPETLGRLQTRAFLQELDVDALKRILTEPKGAPAKQAKILYQAGNTVLTFTEDGLSALALAAYKTKTGARSLMTILQEVLVKADFEGLNNPDVAEVIVDAEAVDKRNAKIIWRNTPTP